MCVLKCVKNKCKCVREMCVREIVPISLQSPRPHWGKEQRSSGKEQSLLLGVLQGISGFPGSNQHTPWPVEYSVLGTLACLNKASLGANVPVVPLRSTRRWS